MNMDVPSFRVGSASPAGLKVIRHADVCRKLGISAASLFDMVAKGDFPKPFSIIPGGRSVGWLEVAVDDWIIARSKGDAA
jgi:prophage regulatory protein